MLKGVTLIPRLSFPPNKMLLKFCWEALEHAIVTACPVQHG